MIKVRQLQAFHAVMVSRTVTEAAIRLRISQPAISSLVSSLEDDLGFKLFIREKGRLQPTDEAGYFHGGVVTALEGLKNIEQLATDIRCANVGTLRVAALPMLALEFLPRVAARFLEEHPGVNITLQARSSETVVNLITTQQFDVGFAETVYDPGWIDAEQRRLRCVCVLPENHPLVGNDVIHPIDLSGLPIITSPRDHLRTQRLQKLFSDYGAVLSIKLETPLFSSMCACVAAGIGCSIVDPITAHEYSGRGLIARRFEPGFFNDFAILFPATKSRSMIAHAFSALVTEFLNDYE